MYQNCDGLSKTDYTILTEKANIVFYVAATMRFESHSNDIKSNTRGTKEVVELCLRMKSLQVNQYYVVFSYVLMHYLVAMLLNSLSTCKKQNCVINIIFLSMRLDPVFVLLMTSI